VIDGVAAEYGPYEGVGIVPRNEEAAERAFAGGDNDLRYHFNLPSSLNLTNQVVITFDAFNLDTANIPDPHYGIEIYFNGVKVMDERIIRTNDLGVAITTEPFTLASVNAGLGLGYDNVVSLKGINYSFDGGGNWMGIDYVQINAAGGTGPQPEFVGVSLSNNRITLTWTGTGALETAPAVIGPWTPVTPAPSSPYTEDVQTNPRSRFYRLRQ
jgi:hypothetical protein